MMLSDSLTIDEIYKYKKINRDMLPDFKNYCENMSTCYNDKFLKNILNKLTENNLNNLVLEINDLSLGDNNMIKLGELLYEKAVSENKFTLVYIKLIKKLNNKKINDLIIIKCNKIFGGCNILQNYIVFVGELYNNELLSDELIDDYIDILFKNNRIEYLCNLIKIIKGKYDNYANVINKIKCLKISNNREKFAIMNLIEKN